MTEGGYQESRGWEGLSWCHRADVDVSGATTAFYFFDLSARENNYHLPVTVFLPEKQDQRLKRRLLFTFESCLVQVYFKSIETASGPLH